jgi:hypothetical protein
MLEHKVASIVARNRVRDPGMRAYMYQCAANQGDAGFPVELNVLSKYTGYFRIVCATRKLWVHDSEVIRV